MATLTIRNLPDDVVERLRASAAENGRSMEQEARELLQSRFPSRSDVLGRVKERWNHLKPVSAKQLREWIEESRMR